jgi:hypothetical protein
LQISGVKRWYWCLLALAVFCPGRIILAQTEVKDTTLFVQKSDSVSGKKSGTESTGKKPLIESKAENTNGLGMPSTLSNKRNDTSSLTDKVKDMLPKSDSPPIKSSLFKKLGLNDSTNLFKRIEKTSKTNGNVSFGYDYGVVPFTTSTTFPLGYFKADGNSKVEAFKLPFDLSFYYSDLKSISGLHNYFRLAFDAKTYQDNIKQRESGEIEKQKAKLGDLYKERQDLEKKLYYLKSMPDPSVYEKGLSSFDYAGMLKTPALPKQALNLPKDSIKLPKDSLSQQNLGGTDSLAKIKAREKQEADSTAAAFKVYEHRYDSIQRVISKYEKDRDHLEWDIMYTKKVIHALEDPSQIMSKEAAPYVSKANGMLMSVRKFEIGLCYPNNSTFLISGAAIKGLNLELENTNFFFAFTYGKTLSTLVYTNNVVQNTLSNTQNLYNFFDFNSVSGSRRVTSVKFGPGKKDETHLHVGILYGVGSSSYPFDLNPAVPQSYKYEKNYVIELDGKVVLTKNNILDLVYGKSSLLQSSSAMGDFNKGVTSILDPLRSNAALARFTSTISKTKTKITLTSRWVDPFFKSYGVGFMRADNFRYEIKAEQIITSKIKLTTLFRKEQDNLLSLYNYNTSLTTIGANLSIKISRNLTVRAGYNPVLQSVTTKDNTYSLNNRNNISNFVITYNPHLKKINTSFNALYSYYNLTSAIQTNVFESINVNNTTLLKSGFRLLSSATWFHSSVLDTNGNNTLLIAEELGYSFKKGAVVSIGGKAAHNSVVDWQYGYIVKALLPVVKHFSIEASFEKLVIGDFYNSFNRAQVQAFPYYCSLKVIYNW